jgi:hypothetical protein
VTLANPFGPPARGWSAVSATLDRAAENYRDGEVVGFDNVSTVTTPDLAYTTEIESYRARVGGADDLAPVAVRVTTVFRREEGIWKGRTGTPIRSRRRVLPSRSYSLSGRSSKHEIRHRAFCVASHGSGIEDRQVESAHTEQARSERQEERP